MSKDTERADRIVESKEQIVKALHWLANETEFVFAQEQLCVAADLIDRSTADLAARDKEIARLTDENASIKKWNGREAELLGKYQSESKRLMDLEEAQRWIPVTERLPEPGQYVLLLHNYHAMIGEHGEYESITVGYYHKPADRRKKPYFYYVGVSDFGDMVRASSMCPGSEHVTYWMPLPAPPKTDKGDT